MRTGLLLATIPYSIIIRLRRWAYRRGWKKSCSAEVPVISVGNITTGGTGKTPTVAWIVRRLQAREFKPGVLLRGYKEVDGRSDEAEMLRRKTGAVVAVDPDRIAGAKAAVANGADVLIMDDGFQHQRLRRKLDIVLIDATEPFGFGHVLPRGLLREPARALKDAHAIVFTRSDKVSPADVRFLRNKLTKYAPRASYHAAVHGPDRLIDPAGTDQPVHALAGKTACAFCGIGNPNAFFETLKSLKIQPVIESALDDHAQYTPAVMDAIRKQAAEADAHVIITTEKDYVKLQAAGLDRDVWQLAIDMKILGGRDQLLSKIFTAANGEKVKGRSVWSVQEE
ncbi:MAG: tetraacyldisaccharide 4'-kinase [Phycisphaerae bacterium]